jgi:hypothetical protein
MVKRIRCARERAVPGGIVAKEVVIHGRDVGYRFEGDGALIVLLAIARRVVSPLA